MSSLVQQIAREERINLKLTELLTKLQQPEPHQLTSVPYQNTTQLQIAQLTNINKKISIYQEELQKIKDKNYPKIISEIKSIKNSIFQSEQLLEDLNEELASLEAYVPMLQKRQLGKLRNESIQKMYSNNKYEVEKLKRKFTNLQNFENCLKFKTTKRLRNMSQRQKIGDKNHLQSKNIGLQSGTKQQKKEGVDKFALYKNLIKFYTIEEEKLRSQISVLQKQAASRSQFQQSMKKEIEQYKKKIQETKTEPPSNNISLLK